MCQIRVVVEENEGEQLVLENVTRLDVVEQGIRLSSFFEEPVMVDHGVVKHIDFLDGKVVLARKNGA
ncbi:MAG: CooT family nickel-binding protein [Thermodesulfobacteriota bacterium]